jgi:hypothetical protein
VARVRTPMPTIQRPSVAPPPQVQQGPAGSAAGNLIQAQLALRHLQRSIQVWALAAIATPFDKQRLRGLDMQIDGLESEGVPSDDRTLLKHFVRTYGRRERKRPRDRLLRDRNTRRVVMDVRKRTAFLGYTWHRIRPIADRPGLPATWEEDFPDRGEMAGQDDGHDGGYDHLQAAIQEAEDIPWPPETVGQDPVSSLPQMDGRFDCVYNGGVADYDYGFDNFGWEDEIMAMRAVYRR